MAGGNVSALLSHSCGFSTSVCHIICPCSHCTVWVVRVLIEYGYKSFIRYLLQILSCRVLSFYSILWSTKILNFYEVQFINSLIFHSLCSYVRNLCLTQALKGGLCFLVKVCSRPHVWVYDPFSVTVFLRSSFSVRMYNCSNTVCWTDKSFWFCSLICVCPFMPALYCLKNCSFIIVKFSNREINIIFQNLGILCFVHAFLYIFTKSFSKLYAIEFKFPLFHLWSSYSLSFKMAFKVIFLLLISKVIAL